MVSLLYIQTLDQDGNLLFYADQETTDNQNVLQTTIEDTGLPIFYKPITSENLTAGTTWVESRLIRGNGRDNATRYAQGFVDGLSVRLVVIIRLPHLSDS